MAQRVALVTGGMGGLGEAICMKLERMGVKVIVTYSPGNTKHKDWLKDMEGEGHKFFAFACDVSDFDSCTQMVAAVTKDHGPIDILINNAGIAHSNLPVEKLPFPLWKDVLETNLDGMFLVTQAALAIMKRGSTIVNNLSIAANRVFAGSGAYNASKHGALGLTNTLREELRPRGIRVIGLLPGATDTDIWGTLWPQAPRRKMMAPETVAQTILQALLLPPNATAEVIEILPSVGTL